MTMTSVGNVVNGNSTVNQNRNSLINRKNLEVAAGVGAAGGAVAGYLSHKSVSADIKAAEAKVEAAKAVKIDESKIRAELKEFYGDNKALNKDFFEKAVTDKVDFAKSVAKDKLKFAEEGLASTKKFWKGHTLQSTLIGAVGCGLITLFCLAIKKASSKPNKTEY